MSMAKAFQVGLNECQEANMNTSDMLYEPHF